jgi:tetratricopeptide (TPR) repeat protein
MIEKIEIIEDVQKLILSFSKEKLTTEEEVICMHIWKKLTRKRTLDITRTRSDIWAAAVIWSFCRANFKYEAGITLDTVCDFFSNKKTTVGNKAGEIIKMLKIDYFNPEYSTTKIKKQNPINVLTQATDDVIRELQEENYRSRVPDPKRRQAEATLNESFELLERGQEEEAGRLFFKSIEIDPTLADGYNHLALIAWRKEDWKQAEGLYRKALELAEPEIKGIRRGSFWGVTESRPYMRALHGLGLTAWKQGRLDEAKDIFEKMLKLDSNDNLGAGFLIGPVYHQMGDLDKAAVWYAQHEDDPHNLYNHGLVLIRKKSLEMATLKLVSAIIENPYVAPMLLKEPLPECDWWHSSSLAEPQYAEDYVREYQSWWQKDESALKVLHTIWVHGEVQRTLRDFIAMRRYLKKSGDGEPGYVRKGLIGPEKLKKLAEKIYAGFTQDDTGQMRLV